MQRGVEEALAPHRMRMMLGNSNESPDCERLLLMDFVGWNVDGMIVVPTGTADAFQGAEVPIVLASRAVTGADLDTVFIDDVAGARDGVRVLMEAGHARIGFIATNLSESTG